VKKVKVRKEYSGNDVVFDDLNYKENENKSI
jgi:hypothetical protein